MMRKLFSHLEDPTRPLLGPNYWILRKLGLILPENKRNKILYLILHATISLFIVTEFIELYIVRSNLDLVLTNLRISIVSFICISKANTFVFWQIKWKDVLDYVTRADKYERDDKDNIKSKIVNGYTKYAQRVTFFYWILVFTTLVSVSITPVIRYFPSAYRDGVVNSTQPFPHIFIAWVPFDKETSPGSWINVIFHIAIASYGGGVMASYDSTVIVIMVFFGGQLELIQERCRRFFGCRGLGVRDDEAKEMIREIHGLHVDVMKYLKLFNSLLSPVMFLYVVMCSFMLCASAYQISSATHATQKLIMAEYLIFGVTQLFMFCWQSNDVLVKGINVAEGPYDSEWWVVSAKLRRSVILLTGQLRLVHVFKAGPFTQLTLSTFVGIMKGAYSYYTLLRR